jgi:hypothetical protein
MTIKQQGGVFGRNPTFNDATVNEITIDGLRIYFDGTRYMIASPATEFRIQTSDFRMVNSANNEVGLKVVENGAATLYWDGASRLVTADAGVQVTGNVIMNSGKGIDFSATSGTGTSELFDDYEEGTWTPTVAGQSSGGTGTYTSQSGGYRKVGGMVQAWFQVGISAHTGVGVIDIEGFPFTSANDGLAQVGTAATLDMTYTAAGVPILRMTANSAKANLQTIADGASWTSQSLATDTVFTIYGSICYKTA